MKLVHRLFSFIQHSVKLEGFCLVVYFCLSGVSVGAQDDQFAPLLEASDQLQPPVLHDPIAIQPMLTPDIIRELDDQDPNVRFSAAKLLLSFNMAGIQLAEYIPQLASAVTNKDVVVRRYVTAILSRMGEKSYDAAPMLVRGLSDNDSTVRRNSAGALAKSGASAAFAVPALETSLSDTNIGVRAYAAGALGRIGRGRAASQAIPALERVLKDPSFAVREYAIRALGDIGAEARFAVPELTGHLKECMDSERILIFGTLAKIALRLLRIDGRRIG